jgi:hypothetical protein
MPIKNLLSEMQAEVHHPEYNFDDEAILFGASYRVGLTETCMPAARKESR